LPNYKEGKMKRLLATLSVLAALAVSAVATVPATAEPIHYDGATLECEQTSGGAKYTLKYTLGTKTLELSHTFPGTCKI
jgi:hypothetical protein